MNVGDSLEISHIPQLGPHGISMTHNDRVEPLSVKDAFEVLRWMRDELRGIRIEMQHVHGMKQEMEKIRAIHAKQGMIYKRYQQQLSELDHKIESAAQEQQTKYLELAGRIGEQSYKIANLSSHIGAAETAITELSASIRELARVAKIPWWKKIFGGAE